jgi:hypothetical protein
VATDTALALDSHQGSAGHQTSVLITAQDLRMTLSPCMDTIVFIQEQLRCQLEGNDKTWLGKDDDQNQDSETTTVQVQSTWKAEIQSTLYASPEIMDGRPTIVEYSVVESNADGEREIRWKVASSV